MSNLRSDLYSAFYYTDPAPIVEFLQWLAVSYNVSNPPRILDIGCGPGRMLPEFAKLGWETTGMEPDPDYLFQATEVAESWENVTVQPGGFGDIEAEEKFDIIAAINGPFYYLLKLEDRIDALQRMFQALKPGGIMFLAMANFLWILKNFKPQIKRTTTVNGKKIQLVVNHSIDFHNSIFIAEDIFSNDIEEETFNIFNDNPEEIVDIVEVSKFAIIQPSELLYFVQKTGFKNIQTYNSYKARKSEKLTSSHMMLSAQKPI